MLVIANPDKRILFLSNPYCGSVHDYSILQSEFDPNDPLWFTENDIHVDLGFLGIKKDYEGSRIKIPIKRKRRNSKKETVVPFSEAEKELNKKVSSERIYVENAIGGMKRYWWLTHRLRCRDAEYYSMIAGVAAGLWNFSLKP
jgi:hypothetical protein